MQPIKNTVQTDFELAGIASAIADARTLAGGINSALDGLRKVKPLDGIAVGLEKARVEADKLNKTAGDAEGSRTVRFGVTGIPQAISAAKGFGKAIVDAFDDAKPESVVDFDAVREKILGTQRAIVDQAEATAAANVDAGKSTRSLGDAIVKLKDRILGNRKAAEDAGEALAGAGKKGKKANDDTAKSSKDAGDRLKTLVERGNKLSDGLNAVGKSAAKAGVELAKGFGERSLEGLRKGAEYARKFLEVGTIVAGLSGLSLGGIFGAITKDTTDYTLQVQKLSNITGIETGAFSRLSSVAKTYGVELDDLRGIFGQFTGQASAASRGEDVAKYFQAMGVSVTDANGRLKDTLPLFLEVAKAQKTLSQGGRAEALSQLFGEDDASKIVTLLDALGGSFEDVKKAIDAVDASGDVVNPDDVKNANDLQQAYGAIGANLRGLGRTIARDVLPDVTEFAKEIGVIITASKDGVAGTAKKAWSLLADGVRDVLKYFTGRQDYIKNSWLIGALDTVRAFGTGLGTAGRAALEFGDILRGKTLQDKDFEFPQLFTFKDRLDRAFTAGGNVFRAFLGLLGGVKVDVDSTSEGLVVALEKVSNQAVNALNVLGGTEQPTTWLGQKAKEADETAGYFLRLKDAIIAVASGKEVKPEFQWLANLKKTLDDTAASLNKMAGEVTRAAGEIVSLGEKVGITGGGIVSFAANFAGLAVELAAVLLPMRLVTGALGAIGLAGAAPLAMLAGLALAAGLVWKKVWDNWKEAEQAEAEFKKGVEDADALIYKYGLPNEAARQRFNDNQAKRRAMGLPAQELGPGPYEPRPANLPPRQAPAAANDDSQTLRGILGQVTTLNAQAQAAAAVDYQTALTAAGRQRGAAIVAAAMPSAPGIVDSAVPPGSQPAPKTRQPIVINLVAEDGTPESFEFDADTDVATAFQDALLQQRQRQATQRPPRFAIGG